MSSELLDRIRIGGDVPAHVAVIMDGNGRWARRRGLPRHVGHRQGIDAVREIVEGSAEAGLRILTLFAFSTENWYRPAAEIGALMGLLRLYAGRERRSLREQGVRVRVLGEVERLDPSTRGAVDRLAGATADGDRLRLNVMISYGGREELVRAARRIASEAAAGRLDPEDVDAEQLERGLFTHGLPDPDLLIRTSGEQRISNFLLWQLAYTEIHTTSVLWPDFRRGDLFRALLDYQGRERRFGRVHTG